MEDTAKKALGIAGSALMLGSMGLGATTALAAPAPAVDDPAAVAASEAPASDARVTQDRAEGTFAYSQAVLTPRDAVARGLGRASAYLCGSSVGLTADGAAADWAISVGGPAAGNPVIQTMGEMAEEGAFHAVMGCSCAGNPSDGNASANADVQGVTVAYMAELAQADPAANTIVFTSSDGYEVALPADYVLQRTSMVVYALDGSELGDTIGGVNQLWLGSTSARYFVRNVSTVSFEVREAAPPAPGSAAAGDAYANVPNISVVYGGAA